MICGGANINQKRKEKKKAQLGGHALSKHSPKLKQELVTLLLTSL